MITPLTSLRFFAAFFVFLWHVKFLKTYQTGYMGVSFFFVLSGFILTYTYTSKMSGLKLQVMRSFYVSRVAKIFPLHVLTFLLACGLMAAGLDGRQFSPWHVVAHVTLLQSFVPVGFFGFNGVAWSLSDELFFYLLFPFLLVVLRKLTSRGTARVVAGGMLGLWVFLVVSFLQGPDVKPDNWQFYVFPVTRLADFLFGMLLCIFYLKVRERIETRVSAEVFTWLEVLVCALIAVMVFLSPHVPQILRFSLYYLPAWCLVVLVFAFQRGRLSTMLSHPVLKHLGEVSFAFYMVHQLVLKYLEPLHWQGFWAEVALPFGIALALSLVLYRFYEEPARKAIRRSLAGCSRSELHNLKA